MVKNDHFVKNFYVKTVRLQTISNPTPIWRIKIKFVPLPTLEWVPTFQWPQADAWAILMAGTPQPNTPTTMGKQISVLRIKGSVGEVTGYKMNTSSKTSKSGDFIRSKATSVANPRSYAQARQRAKARPAQLFYAAFVNVLDHAFYPLGKPVKNRNRFMSLAMKLGYVPDVKKSEVKLPFAPYQVSEGTLGLDSLAVGAYSAKNDTRVSFGVKCNVDFDENYTVGRLSHILLSLNPLLQEGMELTFLVIVANGDNPSERYAKNYSLVLDTNDNVTKISNIFSGYETIAMNEDDYVLSIQHHVGLGDNNKILCAGLIISSKTSSSWQYTNSFMALSAYAIDGFDWKEREIIESYMNEARDRNSDKILQQADNAQGETVPIVSVGDVEITLAQGVTGNLNQTDAAIAQTRFGISKVVVSDRGQLQWYNAPAKTWTPITLASGHDDRPLVLADTTWAGSQTITIAECQAAGF